MQILAKLGFKEHATRTMVLATKQFPPSPEGIEVVDPETSAGRQQTA